MSLDFICSVFKTHLYLACYRCYVSHFFKWYTTLLTSSIVLDPHISYNGLLEDCGDNSDACSYLGTTKEPLHAHFHAVASTSVVSGSPQKVDFTSCYQNIPQAFINEVQEYFKLPHENFNTYDPLQWWAGWCSQFPNLSRFTRDILVCIVITLVTE